MLPIKLFVSTWQQFRKKQISIKTRFGAFFYVVDNMAEKGYWDTKAIHAARGLRKKLEEENTAYGDEMVLCRKGELPIWSIATPVYCPINNTHQKNLITLSGDISEANIQLLLPSFDAQIVNAYFRMYREAGKKDKVIVVVARYNFCWTRYLVCKELLHLFLYTPDVATVSLGDLNSVISRMLNITKSVEVESEKVLAEKAAYYGAVELLIPTELVPSLRLARDELEATEEFASTANYEIAKKLGVPESLVEFRLDEKMVYNPFDGAE